MELSDKKQREYVRRILTARMRLLLDQSFYGLLIMHVKIALSDLNESAWTDNQQYIYFNPDFLDSISDRELVYVLEHEVMHIVLKHVERMLSGDFDAELYNIASDIVVNSSIMRAHGGKESSISIQAYGGAQMHKAPDGSEGYDYTVEEIYRTLETRYKKLKEDMERQLKDDGYEGWDIHIIDGDNYADDKNAAGNIDDGESNLDKMLIHMAWQSWIISAAEMAVKYGGKGIGSLPMFVERYIRYIKQPELDWRIILNEFVQEEVNDYSFSPPDKRFSESPFYLPDYNDTEFRVEKMLFMIDTSGSMSDEDISDVYSEIKGAIDQFNGKLQGWLGFFDAAVYPPQPFSDEEEFDIIRPEGGGGTRFDIIFDYVRDEMTEEAPVLIIILTDGYAPFPAERAAEDKPVLWILINSYVNPPWGKVARIKSDRE